MKKFHRQRVAIPFQRAADIVARDKTLKHPVNLAWAFAHFLHDFRSGQAAGMDRKKLKDIKPFIKRRGAIALFCLIRFHVIPVGYLLDGLADIGVEIKPG